MLPYNERSSNAAKAVESSYRRGGHGTMPLARDIVGLIATQRSPVAHICPGCEKYTDIAHSDLVWKPQHCKAENEAEAIEDNDWASSTIL